MKKKTPYGFLTIFEDKNINIIEKGTTEIDTAQCKCKNVPRLCRKLYLQGQYHYAIKAKVNSIKVHGELTLINVTVLHVIKHTKIPLKVKANVFLWTINSSCPCPQLSIGKKYLIIGYEDVDNARLLYIFGSVGTRWRNVYTKRLSDWDRKLQRILKKRVKNKKVKEERRKRRRKNKKTPRYLRTVAEFLKPENLCCKVALF
ncbi:Secreted frizzled-related protein 3 [Nymphon striatum]|nr:Secreted frizzled-related protein 3 [Nymphon striatum]